MNTYLVDVISDLVIATYFRCDFSSIRNIWNNNDVQLLHWFHFSCLHWNLKRNISHNILTTWSERNKSSIKVVHDVPKNCIIRSKLTADHCHYLTFVSHWKVIKIPIDFSLRFQKRNLHQFTPSVGTAIAYYLIMQFVNLNNCMRVNWH